MCEIFTNEILISCVGTFGKISLVPKEFERGIINPRLLKISPNELLINPKYFLILLRSNISFSQFECYSRGGTMGVINLEILKQLKFSIPPIKEQVEIIQYIEIRTKEMDDLIHLEQKKIDLLKEYRQSLISEVVTGKIKVTTDE
jgi:type I restriction enzyme S subunit